MLKKLLTLVTLLCIISMSLFTAAQADQETKYLVS